MAWASHGWLHGALAVSASLLLAARAPAEVEARAPADPERGAPERGAAEPQGDWLRWEGPIECQNTREVERQLESLLGYAPERSQLPPTRVEVGWGSARGWSLLIRVGLAQGERRREVVVRTCADGFDVVALTLALILDPELGGESEDLDAEPLPAVDGLSTTEAEPAPEPAEGGAAARMAAALAPTPDLSTALAEAEPAATSLAERPRTPALSVVGGGRADLGTLPATLLGGGASLSLSGWQWRLDAGGAHLGRGAQSLPLAVNQVSYTNSFGLLRGCRQLSPRGGGHFDLCLGGQLGSLAVREQAGERRRGRGLWAAATLGAELGLELSDAWSAFSAVELVFPLARHELGLVGGAVVYELPAVSVQLTAGALVRLTEWAEP